MKSVSQLAGFAVVFTFALVVAAEELPKLIDPAAAIFTMALIGRMVWLWTQRW